MNGCYQAGSLTYHAIMQKVYFWYTMQERQFKNAIEN